MTIKYIVFSGGGTGGLCTYGVFKQLLKVKYINLENINGVYATSIGCIAALFCMLKIDEVILYDYLIKRPWDKIFDIHPAMYEIINNKGLLDYTVFQKIINPLITVKNLDENITLKELYEYTKIDYHLYTTNINNQKPICIDLSHKTHPDLEVYKAIAMSSAIPVIFKPIFYNNGCYIDGGLLNNVPINSCIEDSKCDLDELLVISSAPPINTINIQNNTPFHHYMFYLFNTMFNMMAYQPRKQVKQTIECFSDICDMQNWLKPLTDQDYRIDMVNHGVKCAKDYLNLERP